MNDCSAIVDGDRFETDFEQCAKANDKDEDNGRVLSNEAMLSVGGGGEPGAAPLERLRATGARILNFVYSKAKEVSTNVNLRYERCWMVCCVSVVASSSELPELPRGLT